MTVVDNEMERLWGLIVDLSNQLTINRQYTETLRRQSEEVKAQSFHAGSGFTLRRFNTDVSKEEFESDLERMNVALVMENRNLHNENKQLNLLLKDYDSTLESIMGKFRGFAHSTQRHELDVARHYEGQLMNTVLDPNSVSPYPGRSLMIQQHNDDQQQQQQHPQPDSNPETQSNPPYNSNENHLLDHQQQQQQQAQHQGNSHSISPSSSNSSHVIGQHDPLYVYVALEHISELVRKAYRSLNGEDVHDDGESDEYMAELVKREYAEDVTQNVEESSHHKPAQAASLSEHTTKEKTETESPGADNNTGNVDSKTEDNKTSNENDCNVGSIDKNNNSSSETDVSSESSFGGDEEITHDIHAPMSTIQSKRNSTKHQIWKSRNPTRGGYLSLVDEPADEALERDAELERVRFENEMLRNLLGISKDPTSTSSTASTSSESIYSPILAARV